MKPFEIILADPAWKYSNERSNDPAQGGMTYETLAVDQIAAMNVQALAADDCALFLWATMPKLQEAMTVMAAWGFNFITVPFVWLKLNPTGTAERFQNLKTKKTDLVLRGGFYSGLGHWTNGNAELVLYGKKGKPKRQAKDIKQIMIEPRGRHSAKPAEIRKRIERLIGKKRRVELFARENVPGWHAWGNDCDSINWQTWPLIKCEFCGYKFDPNCGGYGCPNCHGEGLE